MFKSKKRLLLNAQPFGFGPSAAMAAFFPYLRKKFSFIGYIGERHTLDLQQDLNYDEIFNISNLSPVQKSRIFDKASKKYDVFFTSMDFELAEEMKKRGLEVILYDALTWYWNPLPSAISSIDLYITQNFLGVKERISKNRKRFAAVEIVPPIIATKPPKRNGKYALINLGGLNNPHWTDEDTLQYARFIIPSLLSALPAGEPVKIAANRKIAADFNDPRVHNYSKAEMNKLLAGAKYALMTPGLGNMFDAALYDLPTIWLPPANDSQGEQLDLAEAGKVSDGNLDWGTFAGSRHVRYTAPEPEVMKKIRLIVYSAHKKPEMVSSFIELAKKKIKKIRSKKTSKIRKLIIKFGAGGAEQAAKKVYDFSKTI